MLSRFALIVYLLSALLSVFISYNSYTSKSTFSLGKSISTLDKNVFQRYQKIFDTNQSFGYIWGLKDEINKTKNQKNSDTKDDKTEALLSVTQKNFSLCVKKDCFRFLGIYHKKNRPYISLFNKNFKHKLDDFGVNDTIGYTLYVKSIKQNRAVIADANSSRVWSFELFDVNATKYRPKDIDENNY